MYAGLARTTHRGKRRAVRQTPDGPEIECRFCGQFKPATTEYFYIVPHGQLGLGSMCKPCYNARTNRSKPPPENGAAVYLHRPDKRRSRRLDLHDQVAAHRPILAWLRTLAGDGP